MEKVTREAIKAMVPIIAGIIELKFYENDLLGMGLVLVGLGLIFVDKDLRDTLWALRKLIPSSPKTETKQVNKGAGGNKTNIRTGDNSQVTVKIENRPKRKTKKTISRKSSSGMTNEQKKVLREVRNRMADTKERIFYAASHGVQNKAESKEISDSVREYADMLDRYKSELDDEMFDVLSNVLGAFVKAILEIDRKATSKEFNKGFDGSGPYEFVSRFNYAQKEIKRRLLGPRNGS